VRIPRFSGHDRGDGRIAGGDRAWLIRLAKTEKVDIGRGERDPRDFDDL
jgi:hypothetical protein